MEYCADCMRLCSEKCPGCGSRKLRTPEENDPVLLTEKLWLDAEILSQMLSEKEIPFLKKSVGPYPAAYFGTCQSSSEERYQIFVPFAATEQANALLDALEAAAAVPLAEGELPADGEAPEDALLSAPAEEP